MLITAPPTISQANSKPPSSSGRTPARRTEASCVVRPSAAIAMASKNVSALSKVLLTAADSGHSEWQATTAMKAKANHGMPAVREANVEAVVGDLACG